MGEMIEIDGVRYKPARAKALGLLPGEANTRAEGTAAAPSPLVNSRTLVPPPANPAVPVPDGAPGSAAAPDGETGTPVSPEGSTAPDGAAADEGDPSPAAVSDGKAEDESDTTAKDAPKVTKARAASTTRKG